MTGTVTHIFVAAQAGSCMEPRDQVHARAKVGVDGDLRGRALPALREEVPQVSLHVCRSDAELSSTSVGRTEPQLAEAH